MQIFQNFSKILFDSFGFYKSLYYLPLIYLTMEGDYKTITIHNVFKREQTHISFSIGNRQRTQDATYHSLEPYLRFDEQKMIEAVFGKQYLI